MLKMEKRRLSSAEVENAVLAVYSQLPKKGKPLLRSNGVKEWTVLAGVVITLRNQESECVALATGVKTTPESMLHDGEVLHDCHAEILALRAFNAFLARAQLDPAEISHLYLYICAPPCGDSSMSLLNGGPSWELEDGQSGSDSGVLRGREHFNLVGRVRTKPGRQDSQLSMSKSCSDKLCLRQCKGILLAPLRQLWPRNVYIDTLVCPVIEPDFTRCFARFPGAHQRFDWDHLDPLFPDYHPEDGAPSPCSVVWARGVGHEVIARGVVQGSRKASMVSRRKLFEACYERDPAKFSMANTYYDLKQTTVLPPGWVRTAVDDFPLHTP